jgi:hypothetical protein
MRSIIMGTALALSLAVAGTAQADTVTTTFDGFANGSVNGQGNWTADATYDQAVVDVLGGKALRISNAVTDGSFAGMPYSAPVTIPAGENEANNVLTNEFTFQAPDSFTPGLAVSISPTGAGGSRMSYVRLEDHADGVKVVFRDGTFADQLIDTLDRSVPHTIKFETTFVRGDDNDVVRVFIDGTPRVRGASWENYYRFDEHLNPAVTDRLMWRLNLTPTAAQSIALNGNGFLFDNVTSTSSHVNNPAPLNPPAPGPAGQNGTNGTNGTNGVDGKDGVNGTNGLNGKDGVNSTVTLRGASIRHLRIRKTGGMKFLSAKATMGGKRLSVKGRTVKVDLRGKSAGEYRVFITAKYQANGKVYKVRSVRSLSIIGK